MVNKILLHLKNGGKSLYMALVLDQFLLDPRTHTLLLSDITNLLCNSGDFERFEFPPQYSRGARIHTLSYQKLLPYSWYCSL